jgi:hypothetical protein
MLRSSFLPLASFAFVAVATAACSPLGESTDGDNGTLRFEYTGGNCLFGCGLDRSALEGSLVSISARGGDGDVRKRARLVGADVGSISEQRESCSCQSTSGSSSRSRGVEPAERCTSNETKSCSLNIDLETAQSGEAKLEITEPSGKVVDRVTIHVRPAARIDVDVKQGATERGGVYEVKNGFKVKVRSTVFDAEGGEAVFTRHGVSHDYGNKSILKPDSSVLVGSTDVEDMIASGLGETTVTVRAEGAEKLIRFRVVP